MSDVSRGPGWWMASDGKWYPPHLHPDHQAPAAAPPLAGPPAQGADPAQPGVSPAAPGGRPSRLPRRPLVVAGVVVAALVLAGVLVVALSNGGSSGPLAHGTPSGEGFGCRGEIFLTWTTSGDQLHGFAEGPAGSPEHVALTGQQSGSHVTLDIEGQRTTGELTATALAFQPEKGVTVSCTLMARRQFLAASERALGPAADDRVAQSDLTNALTAAKAEFVSANAYAATPQLVAQLNSEEPDVQFTAGPATKAGQISVLAAPNGQAVILASRSSDGRCWYAADVEANTPASDLPTTPPASTSYDASSKGHNPTTCSAASPATGGPWSTRYPS